MINLQKEFIEFDDKIKLSYDDNSELREKRDILLKKLKENISKDAASFTHFNQGSYAMMTGIKPDSGDYDIDVGLRFSLTREDYPDPVSVKQWVYDALNGHTKKVEIRRSCVTVTYQEDGEDAYHVDFACYADEDDNLYIGKGKKNSEKENRFWDESDPMGLIETLLAMKAYAPYHQFYAISAIICEINKMNDSVPSPSVALEKMRDSNQLDAVIDIAGSCLNMAMENASAEATETGRIFVPQNWIKSKASLKDIRNAIRNYLTTLKVMPNGKQILERLNKDLSMEKEDFEARWTAD